MKTRKILQVLLLAVCMQVIFLLPQTARAAEMIPVTPNETFYGKLEERDTEHYYSFTVDKSGYFNIDFSLMDFAADVEDGWKVELYYGETGISFYSTTLTSNATLPVFNFKQGTKLYIAVSARMVNYAPVGQVYAINIKTTEDKSWEQESDDISTNTTLINGDEIYHGNLYYKNDVDYYEYTVSHDGYFNVNFSLADVTADTEDGWKVDLCYGETGTSFYSATLTSNATFPVFNFKQGTKLYIAVSARMSNYAPLCQEYLINVKTTKDISWEQEKNDVSADSTLINGNKIYHGNLYYKDDVDYYEYTVSHNGYFNINFSLADVTADTGDGWRMELYNGDSGKSIYSVNLQTSTALPVFNFQKGTKIYIAISARLRNYAPLWQEYSINIKTTNASDWEKETLIGEDASWSTRSKNATSISLGKKYCGNMCMESDNDLYKFSVDKTGYVTIKFDPDDVESNLGSGYAVKILTKSGKVASENRVTAVTNIKTYLTKGTYYVEVSRNYSAPVLKTYFLSASHKAQMPAKVSSIKKKGTKVSWKKVSDADGYEVCYAMNKNFKKASKISLEKADSNSYELYGLQERKTYYVRVRAYKIAGADTKVYGGWSSTVKVKKK